MKNKSHKNTRPTSLVFFGSSQESANLLRQFIVDSSNPFDICLVVTQAQRESSHKHQADTPVALVAEEFNLNLIRPIKVAEAIPVINELQPTAGLLFAYGQLLPDSLLTIFPQGIINVHPSLLPLHRGPSPIEATILEGDVEAGTSLMLIETAMDTGPILAQSKFAISPTISKIELTDQLMKTSQKILLPTLEQYLAGKLNPQAQPSGGATYSRLIKKSDGLINLTDTAAQIERQVRAYAGWPSAQLSIKHNEQDALLKIHQANLLADVTSSHPELSTDNSKLLLILPSGSLELIEVQLPSRSRVSGPELIRGAQLQLLS